MAAPPTFSETDRKLHEEQKAAMGDQADMLFGESHRELTIEHDTLEAKPDEMAPLPEVEQ